MKWKVAPLVLLTACYSVDYPDQQKEPLPEPTNDAPEEVVKQPHIDAFAVSASQVLPGDEVDLTYSVSDAETVKIETDAGMTVLPATTELMGTWRTRAIEADTVFIITATNKDKTAARQLPVTVKAAEDTLHAAVLSFDGPTTVDIGAQGMLIWRTQDAASGVIKANDTVLFTIPTAELPAGSYMVGPATDTIYTLTVKGTDQQEVTMTRLISVNQGGGAVTARQLFDRNVQSILQQKCGACHQGAVPDATGPKFLGATTAAYYAAITQDTRFMTQVPENSLFLIKGEHAGPAFCNAANSAAPVGTLNYGCMPTTEEQTVTAWLLKEAEERFGGQTPTTPTPTPMDYTPRTVSEALTRFQACMSLTDWNNTYAQGQNTEVAYQNSTEGRCYACHSTGTGGAFLSQNSSDTFDQHKLNRTFVLKLVLPSAPGTGPNGEPLFNPALLMAYRYRDKGAENAQHPQYVLSQARQQALDDFISLTLTKYNDFTTRCGP